MKKDPSYPHYDCLIVGAGPAGLFAAYTLVEKGFKKVAVIDKGKSVKERKPENTMYGVGGAGLFSDGKLNLTPKRFKTDLTEFLPLSEAEKLIEKIEAVLTDFGANEPSYPEDYKKAGEFRRNAKRLGLDLLVFREKHLGSDRLPIYIGRFENYLKKKGVTFILEEEAEKILTDKGKVEGVELAGGRKVFASSLIVAPGRGGNTWLTKQLETLGVKTEQKGIEIGVRVEVPEEVLGELTDIIYDPPIFLRTDSFDDLVEVFCTNPKGFVVQENYKDFACVNGHACKNNHSQNSNFALLVKVNLTEPVTDTISYGENICRLAMTIGGGKPLLQRFADFKRHRRSTWERLSKSYIEPTFKEVTPGDISMAFPHRIVVNLIEALEKLNKLIPGVASDSTLLYAPEAKFFSVRPAINKSMETKISGLFVAGDGAGVSGNIVGAAATGIIAANGVAKK
ncbi:MAG: FAD-dependent oxidoreductase [bacterium]|nr:FAD-dependent oxidoreductase [bacterium]